MGNKNFKKELMHRTILYLTVLFVFLFLMTGYFYGRNLSDVINSSNDRFLGLLKSQTLHFLEHPIGEIMTIEQEMNSHNGHLERTQEDYHQYVLRVEQLNEQGIIEKTFPEIQERVGIDLSGNPFIDQLETDRLEFSDTYIDYYSKKTVMMVGKKMDSGGALIGYMDLEKLSNAFSSFKTENSIFAIIDNRGNYILHPDDKLVASRSVDPFAQEIRTGAVLPGDLLRYNGRIHSIDYTLIENTNWYLIIYQDYFQSFGPIFLTISVVLFFMGVIFFIAFKSFKVSFNKLEKGFSHLIETTRRVAKGDYKAMESTHDYIEFDDLSSSFSMMVDEIESREEEIQKYNSELHDSREELKASNDELYATLQQLMAIEKAHREQNEYLDKQNTRLSNLIKGTNAGTWEWDLPSGHVIINERWAEMIGYVLSELEPFNLDLFMSLVHSDDRKELKSNLDPIFEGKSDLLESRFRIRHKKGDWVWVNSIAKVSKYDDNNKPVQLSGAHIDITESVTSAQKIHDRLVETEMLAEFTSKVLVAKDQELFSVIADLMKNVCILKAHRSWDLVLLDGMFKDLPFEMRSNLLPKDPKENFVAIFRNKEETAVFRDEDGRLVLSLFDEHEVIGVIAFEENNEKIVEDSDEQLFYRLLANTISESIKKEQYERGLLESKEHANAANLAKGQFLANMSHELRTPLNGILGYLELILSADDIEEVSDYGQMAIRVTSSMIRLVEDILDFSRIEAGKLKLVNEVVDLKEKILEVVNMYKFESYRKNVEILLRVSNKLPQYILTDTTRIKQIVSNLINNALKFTGEGSVDVELMYEVNTAGEFVSITVSDQGVGIPTEQMEAIFEPFNQGDNSSKRKYGGTGLGLSIVRNIVDLMHGTIVVESIPGKGTTFIVKVPVKSVLTLDSEEANHRGRVNNKMSQSESSKVLIVDDNEINQLVVMKVLEKKGYTCDVASSGVEAVEMVKANTYDCIFMDVQMPELDGYETTRIIRSLPEKSEVFIVAMTANAMAGDREKCLEAGMDDYISKPLDYSKMEELIRSGKE